MTASCAENEVKKWLVIKWRTITFVQKLVEMTVVINSLMKFSLGKTYNVEVIPIVWPFYNMRIRSELIIGTEINSEVRSSKAEILTISKFFSWFPYSNTGRKIDVLEECPKLLSLTRSRWNDQALKHSKKKFTSYAKFLPISPNSELWQINTKDWKNMRQRTPRTFS